MPSCAGWRIARLSTPGSSNACVPSSRIDAGSTPASYWLAAAARGAGDLDRAWQAAIAGWVRASLAQDRGAALRADLDRLVTQAIVPERAARLKTADVRQAVAGMQNEWTAFKAGWSK